MTNKKSVKKYFGEMFAQYGKIIEMNGYTFRF